MQCPLTATRVDLDLYLPLTYWKCWRMEFWYHVGLPEFLNNYSCNFTLLFVYLITWNIHLRECIVLWPNRIKLMKCSFEFFNLLVTESIQNFPRDPTFSSSRITLLPLRETRKRRTVCECVCVCVCVSVDVFVCGCLCVWMSLCVDVFVCGCLLPDFTAIGQWTSIVQDNQLHWDKIHYVPKQFRWPVAICLPTGIPDTHKSLCHVLQHQQDLNVYWGINCQYYKYILNCQYYKYTAN